MKLEDLERICAEATPGPWWVNGLDVESSHVIVGEGEEWTQLFDTETGKPTKKVKQHQQSADDDIRIFTTSSILGDRPFEEALATAEFIAAARTYLPKLIEVAKAAEECRVALPMFFVYRGHRTDSEFLALEPMTIALHKVSEALAALES